MFTHGSILAVFFAASPQEVAEGRDWYDQAYKISRDIAQSLDCPTKTVAAVIAALSPNNKWQRNCSDAYNLIRAIKCGEPVEEVKVSTYNRNKDKAVRIVEAGESVDPLDELGGLKVRAFYECIMGSTTAVCVDGHAYSIWKGERISTTSTPSITPKLYNRISEDYALAAEQINKILGLGLTPAQVQAVTWVTWRNLFGVKRK